MHGFQPLSIASSIGDEDATNDNTTQAASDVWSSRLAYGLATATTMVEKPGLGHDSRGNPKVCNHNSGTVASRLYVKGQSQAFKKISKLAAISSWYS